MAFFPKIPVKFRLYGNRAIAETHIHDGRRLAGELSHSMEFRKLRQGVLERTFADGTKIRVVINHNLTFVDIVSGATYVPCTCCYPCIATGEISKVYSTVVGDRQLYDIDVCQTDGSVTLVNHTMSASWARYEVGQSVLIVSAHPIVCCYDDPPSDLCDMDTGNPIDMTIIPLLCQ